MSDENHMLFRVEYHTPDQLWVAVWMRDGEPWFLNGALVGMGTTQGQAVDDLLGCSAYLVLHAENSLMENPPLPLSDRLWMYRMMSFGSHNYGYEDAPITEQAMYEALRAEGVEHPWQGPEAIT